MTGVFKSYDIRGVYPTEINETLFYNIGLRVRQVGIHQLAVGRDARLSSDSLFHAFVQGLVDAGVHVINIGKVTSPILSFYCATKKSKGAMITASHNPSQYNGIRFVDEKGIQLGYDALLKKIEARLQILH